MNTIFSLLLEKAHVAYIAHDRVVGSPKLPELLEHFARRPQVQERLTRQIADFIDEQLQSARSLPL